MTNQTSLFPIECLLRSQQNIRDGIYSVLESYPYAKGRVNNFYIKEYQSDEKYWVFYSVLL